MRDKIELRAELAARRSVAFGTCPDASTLIAVNFPSSILIAKETIVAGYMPFRTEIDPLPLMRALALKGAQLVLPRMRSPSAEEGRRQVLRFHHCDLDNTSHFTTNKMGIFEPRPSLPSATPAILLVPLLGFDRQGNRIGYGKGYYDQAIARLRVTSNVITIGLAFAEQEVEAIPTQPHDQRLDWIITQNEAYPVPS